MSFLREIWVPILTSIITSVPVAAFAYFKTVKVADTKIEQVRINAKNVIDKIKEESQKELDRIKAENDANIKSMLVENELASKNKEDNIKNSFMASFMEEILKDPQKGQKKLSDLQKLSNMFSNSK